MTLTQITTLKEHDNFKAKAKKENKIFFIKFTASWCGPCKQLAPLVEDIASKQKDNIIVVEVNVDNASELCKKYKIQSIPFCVVSGFTTNANITDRKDDEIKGFNPEKLIEVLKSRMPTVKK